MGEDRHLLMPDEKSDLRFSERLFGRVTKTSVVLRRTTKGACSKEVIEALENTPSTGPLTTAGATAIVQEVWSGFRCFVFIDVGCSCVSAVLLMLTTVSVRNSGTAQMLLTVPLGLFLCKAILEEAFEISAVSSGWGGLVSQYPSILRQAGSIPAFLRQTFEGSFAAASKPIFSTKYSFDFI